MITAIAIIAIALCLDINPDIHEYATITTPLTTTCNDPNCNKCFTVDTFERCYECKPVANTIFDFRTNGYTCWNAAIREISGFGRSCVVCGEGNYPDASGICHPCPYKCKTCALNAESLVKCTECKSSIGIVGGYNTDDDCSCKYGLNMDDGETVKTCFCNSQNYFTYNVDGKHACVECIMCTRNFDNCKVSLATKECPQYKYDPTKCDSKTNACQKVEIDDFLNTKLVDELCCKDCDSTCDYCSGPDELDCIGCKSTATEAFEWVDLEKKCLCVCHSKETIVNNVKTCVCEDTREMVDVCDLANAERAKSEGFDSSVDCTVASPAKYQCLCKSGYISTVKPNSNGEIVCSPSNN